MAKKQGIVEQFAECRRRHDEEERRQRMLTIKEFSAEAGSSDPEAVMHAMAGAILTYRRGLKQLERALGFASICMPFGVLGPRQRERPWDMSAAPDGDDVPPAA
jgi:hypothetical protein